MYLSSLNQQIRGNAYVSQNVALDTTYKSNSMSDSTAADATPTFPKWRLAARQDYKQPTHLVVLRVMAYTTAITTPRGTTGLKTLVKNVTLNALLHNMCSILGCKLIT